VCEKPENHKKNLIIQKMTEPTREKSHANDERVFQVVVCDSSEDLSKLVSDYLRNKWLLHGSTQIIFATSSYGFRYMQTVVKYPGYLAH
jgi:hypothetical protein